MRIAALNKTLPWLLGAVMVTGLAACQTSTPTAGGQQNGGGLFGGGGQQPGAPRADAGIGTNPPSLGEGAPAPQNAAGGQVYFNDPSNFPFVDPVSEGGRASQKFFEGTWSYNGGYMEQSLGARTASLTFRQYAGDGFGASGGVAPAKYRADVTVWVYQNSDQYPQMVGAPLGILGYAPYFINEQKYLLVVAMPSGIPDKPTALEVWAVDGQVPGSEWPLSQRLSKTYSTNALSVGSPVAWSTEIDTTTATAKIWANGAEVATVSHGMLQNAGQRVALVSNGNYLHFQDFKVYRF